MNAPARNRWLVSDTAATQEMPALPANGHAFWRMSKADQTAYLERLDADFRSSRSSTGR